MVHDTPQPDWAGGEEPASLPCPNCEYNLQGQSTPLCPECGQQFASMNQMAAAASDMPPRIARAQAIREWAGIVMLGGMGWAVAAFGAAWVIDWLFSVEIAPIAMLVPFSVSSVLCLGVSGFGLIQSLNGALDGRIPARQRRKLLLGIPFLLFVNIPGFLIGLVLIIWLVV